MQMAAYDLSGATRNSIWTDIQKETTWWDVREPIPARSMPRSPPKLRRTDTSRDVCMPRGELMTEAELDAKITTLKRRNQRLQDSVERLRADMRADLKLD